ncbi:MAG: DUF2141 domain-containing protein [Gammaproteobacteria bacterium]
MKNIKNRSTSFSTLALSAAFAAAMLSTAPAHSGDLTVVFRGLEADAGGTLFVALHDASQEDFPGGEALRQMTAPVQQETVRVVFAGVAPGVYAISSFRDENGDGELNSTIFGIPTEDYAFSNDARAAFGPPDFEKAAFDVGDDGMSIHIKMGK